MGALTTIGSILGMVLGTAGFTVSVLNYLRDRPKVKVLLQWNMTDSRTGIVKGLVRVTNIGRRPVFIGAAAIQIEGGATYLLSDAIPGTKLQEGDKPAGYMVNHEGMEKHSGEWRKVRAFVEDSTGKKYWSKYPSKSDKPPAWVASNKT